MHLDQDSVLFKKRPDGARFVADNLFENRHQNAERIVAHNRSFRNLSDVLGADAAMVNPAVVIYVA